MNTIVEIFVRHTLQVSLLILAIFLLRKALRRQIPAPWLHLLWVVVAIRLLLPVIPTSPWSIHNFASSEQAFSAPSGATVESTDVPSLPVSPAAPPMPEVRPPSTTPVPSTVAADSQESISFSIPEINLSPERQSEAPEKGSEPLANPSHAEVEQSPFWPMLLLGAWASVSLVLLLLTLRRSWLAWRLVQRGSLCTDSHKQDRLNSARIKLGIQRRVDLFVTSEISVPAISNSLRPRLLMPVNLLVTLDRQQQEHVFLHELAHLKRLDHVTTWLMEIGRCLHWFNPLVWFAAHAMHQERELACDAFVLKRLSPTSRKPYGTTLLEVTKFLSNTPAARKPQLAMADSQTEVSRRISAICSFKPPRAWQQLVAALLLGGLTLVFATDQEQAAEPKVTAGEIDPSTKVEHLGSAKKLVFEGNEHFLSDSIRTALISNPAFIRESHPMASLKAYLNTVEMLVRNGYRKDGYRDATANVSLRKGADDILVRITEGPRTTWSDVKIVGIDDVLAARLIILLQADTEELRGNMAIYREEIEAFGILADSESERLLEETGTISGHWKGPNWQSPIWRPNEAVDFSDNAPARYKEAIASSFEYLGHANTQFSLQIQEEANGDTVTFQLSIEDLGPSIEQPTVEVEGNVIHTDGEILEYLNLPERFNGSVFDEIEQKLWDSGRFSDFALFQSPTSLRILVREMPGVSRLDKPLTSVQRAALKLGKWLSEYEAKDYQLHLKGVAPTGESVGELGVYSKTSLMLSMSMPMEGVPLHGQFWYDEGKLSGDWKASGNQGRFVIPATSANPAAHMTLGPTDGVGNKHVQFGIGGYLGTDDRPPVRFIMAPAAILKTLTKLPDLTVSERGELIRLTNRDATFDVLMAADTGRLVSLRANPGGGLQVEGKTSHSSEETMKVPAWTSDPKHSSTLSWLTLLRNTSLLQDTLETDEQWNEKHWPYVELALHGLTPFVDWFVSKSGDATETSAFPSWTANDIQSRNTSIPQLISTVASVALANSHELLPERSWVWEIARECQATVSGHPVYREAMLEKWARAEGGLGPVGSLIVASLLNYEDPDNAEGSSFAKLARERLTVEDFRRDWEALLSEPSRLQQGIYQILRTLSALEPSKLEELSGGSDAMLESLRNFQRSYPQFIADEILSAEELTSLMAAIWKHAMQPQFEKRIEALLAFEDPEDAERVLVKVGKWSVAYAEVILLAMQRDLNPVEDRDALLKEIIERESVLQLESLRPFEKETYEHFLNQADEAPETPIPLSKEQLARNLTRRAAHEVISGKAKESLTKPERIAALRTKYETEQEGNDSAKPFEEVKAPYIEQFLQSFRAKQYAEAVKKTEIKWPK